MKKNAAELAMMPAQLQKEGSGQGLLLYFHSARIAKNIFNSCRRGVQLCFVKVILSQQQFPVLQLQLRVEG
jgi:hypothetical protein